MKAVGEADHAFHVPVRSGRTDLEVKAETIDQLSEWILGMVEAYGFPIMLMA